MSTVRVSSPHILVFALLFALAGCTTLAPVPAGDTTDPASAINAYARVLQRFVNDSGEVDFAALRDDRADLDRYVAFVAKTPAASFTNANDRLAHYINSYNALSMYNVIDSGIPATHAGLNKVRFFALKKFVIGGEAMSLYRYETDVIRKLDEPRIHFALNCSAVSCPVLPRVPFDAEKLEVQLQDETLKFFARPGNLQIDAASKTVSVNEILHFYKDDFVPGHAPNLIAYINGYAPDKIPESYELRFIDYDWTVANSRRTR
jgi:Protein of unknown function, DUF547